MKGGLFPLETGKGTRIHCSCCVGVPDPVQFPCSVNKSKYSGNIATKELCYHYRCGLTIIIDKSTHSMFLKKLFCYVSKQHYFCFNIQLVLTTAMCVTRTADVLSVWAGTLWLPTVSHALVSKIYWRILSTVGHCRKWLEGIWFSFSS